MKEEAKIWMPLYIGDYLSDTAHLTAEESGAYLHLLMHSWKNGSLPKESETLRRISKVEKDAWSNAWSTLQAFFKQCSDGSWVQERLERERTSWNEKKVKAAEKARLAAEKRWGNAPSMPQAMHEQCPSPSPSPSVSKKPSSRPKREREVDPRHTPCRKACEMYAAHKRVEFVWDASEAKQLDLLLAATPSLTVETFQRCLNHRAKSPVAHGERPREWLGTLLRYQEGPLNQFNKPEIPNGQNGTIQGHRPSNAQQRRRSGLDAIASAFPEFLRPGADGEAAGDDARCLPEPGDTSGHSRSVA